MTETEILRNKARSVLGLGVQVLCSDDQDTSARDLAYESIHLATQTLITRHQQLQLPETDASSDYETPEATPPPVRRAPIRHLRDRNLAARLARRHGRHYRNLVVNRRQLDWYNHQPNPYFSSTSGSRQVDAFWAAVRLNQRGYTTFSEAQLEAVANFPSGRQVHGARKRLVQEGLLEVANGEFRRKRGQGRRYRLTNEAHQLLAAVESSL